MHADALPETAAPSPPPGLVIAGCFHQSHGYRVNRPQGADTWLFTWTTSGRGLLRQGAAAVQARAGDLVVLGPGVAHWYGVSPGAEHWAFWWVHCQARVAWSAWLRPYTVADRLHAVTSVPTEGWGRLETAFRRLFADAQRTGGAVVPRSEPTVNKAAVAHSSAARDLTLCSLEEIVLFATVTAAAARPEPNVDPRVRRAEELIAADPGAAHTVRSLARSVSLSPSRFAHLFTEQLGQSPMRALAHARLRHAARLLEDTVLPVERVAAASGFTSPSHFNRAFRQRYGLPPGAYRAMLG